ncbi:PREDICTED: monocarboxylate transporter 9-like [Nicrophorus vespilloides]|uniref:Monocarboxylate transporter 9-like n=1 Tax=Nicrophorus vespilloides TaxID=110193 RepID=A0ABM1MFP5_NICVS|nr:PREDICTED: monocarboxylate transporter 9-like [Nicrophorus vespilloides]XP_017773395.1 PREDICTED: monocarboxylate transporter 9-like [Nicrophorus vespilloides]
MVKTDDGTTVGDRKRRVRVGDPDFAPPDGGWGWLIVLACGFSNLSTFPMFQQFGLLFREKFEQLGISNAETTTVINLNSAFNACVGLLNGPLFRYFSYRQVAFFGATLVSVSLYFTTYCQSFWGYLIVYSMFYGSGIGITQSANALALNTYFKDRRRLATGFSWSTTAMGPIVWPYIITALMSIYAMEGTLMIFAAFAGHAIVCSLLLQPVHWHTKFRDVEEVAKPLIQENKSKEKTGSLFTSQYLFNEDDAISTGYEIIDPGTPRMVGANDGYYSRSLMGSRVSLSRSRLPSGQNSFANSKRPSYNNLTEIRGDKKRKNFDKPVIQEEGEDEIVYPNEKDVLKTAAKMLEEYKEETEEKELSFLQKVSAFFDFDLLKDPIYLNLMLGITIANFAELNFSILTPYVLKEFHFEKYQIATFMSLLGATDICVRFFVPFIAGKIGWDNKTFFLFGVLSMAFGRIILVHTQTYAVSLGVAIIIGFGKGLRTIFMALVIPSYVPLERLPAASGLQLATSGILFLLMGPVVGWIRDLVNNYVITLHILNIMTYVTTIAWTLEKFITTRKAMRK